MIVCLAITAKQSLDGARGDSSLAGWQVSKQSPDGARVCWLTGWLAD